MIEMMEGYRKKKENEEKVGARRRSWGCSTFVRGLTMEHV